LVPSEPTGEVLLPLSTHTRQTLGDIGTVAVVIAFVWMLLF
jgi:hypothetical protein